MPSFHELTIYLYIGAELCYLLAWVLGLIITKKINLKFHYRILLLYLFLEGFIRSIAILVSFSSLNHNLFLYETLGLVELIAIYLIYGKKNNLHWTLFISLIALTYLSLIFFLHDPSQPNIIGSALIRLVIIILGINYLWGLYQKKTLQSLHQIPFFYINAGFMLFAGGSFFVSLLSHKFMKRVSNEFFHNVWIIEAGAILVQLCLITYGLILVKRGK